MSNPTIQIRNENYYSYQHYQTEEDRLMELYSSGKNYTALEASRQLNMDKVNCRRAIHDLCKPKYSTTGKKLRDELLMALPKENARVDPITNKKNTVFEIIKKELTLFKTNSTKELQHDKRKFNQ